MLADLADIAAVAALRHQQKFVPLAGSRQLAVVINGRRRDVTVDHVDNEWIVDSGAAPRAVELAWEPTDRLAVARLSGVRRHVKLKRSSSGFRMRYRGADLNVQVLEPRVADLLVLMPVKVPPDMSKFLLCPMPGQIVRVDVKEGDIVEDGQTLAIVEAMKMENVLKAEKRARVSKVHAGPGSVLAVDQIILEFEAL
ncbi:biotin/lipoyl-containing protein [Devosia sp. A449]